MKEKRPFTIALDFDGVLHKYSKKWHDGTIYDDPCDDAVAAVKELRERGYKIVIFTCRMPVMDVYKWCREKFDLPADTVVTNDKPHADMYIDDRGYHHTSWVETLEEIDKRETYNFGSDDQWKSELIPNAPYIRTETITAKVI